MMKKNKKYAPFFMTAVISLGLFTGCGDSSEIPEPDTGSELISEEETYEKSQAPSVSENKTLPAPSAELSDKLKKISFSAEKYHSKTKDTKEFFSWAGFLAYYEENVPTEVSVETLKTSGYLKAPDVLDNAVILYMKPKDIDPSAKKTSLDIFTAYETTEGFKVIGVGYDEKTIPSDEFRKILMKYNIDNGLITNPKTGSNEYNSIMSSIGDFRGDKKPHESTVPEYIVRYAANNDLYAVVILSGTDDVTDTTEYLLKKGEKGWEVVEKALENQENVKLFLNTNYSDFDLGLLPPYTLYIYRKEVRTTEHYKDIIDMLIKQNIIDTSDTITYCCGTQHVLYMELASGKKLAGGAKKDGNFSCNYINSYEEAVKELGKFVQPVPAFILKYNH